MSTLDHITALIVALHHNDIATTARLLDELEARMDPQELADLLETILGEAPAEQRRGALAAPILASCA